MTEFTTYQSCTHVELVDLGKQFWQKHGGRRGAGGDISSVVFLTLGPWTVSYVLGMK